MATPQQLELPPHGDAQVVFQDGRWFTAAEIESDAAGLARHLAGLKCGRVILSTRRADRVIVSLLACRRAGCDLVLQRGMESLSDLVRAVGADAVMDDTLVPSAAGTGRATASGQVILLTSGTTGVPKAAAHQLDRLLGLIPLERPEPPPRWLLTFAPASFAGLQVILTALVGHAPLAASSAPDMASLTRLALEVGPTAISGTPTFWRAFLPAMTGLEDRVPLRYATVGGEAVDQSTLDRIAAHFPKARITHIYASTEAGAAFAVRDGKAGFPAAWLGEDLGGVRLRAVDGVLQVNSARRMESYVSGQEMPVDGEGWLDTGDLVETVGDRVYFRGRQGTLINVGGNKVRPEEVEAAILQVPGVVDVQVKGLRNAITGELVGADIVVAPGLEAQAVTNQVKQAMRSLPPYAIPRIIRVVPHLAEIAGGKKRRS